MLTLYDKDFYSRMLLGSAQYPSPDILRQAISASASEIVTLSLRRETQGKQSGFFWRFIKELGVTILPNTAGCCSVKEAVLTAHLARDVLKTNWIKLEVIGDQDSLRPDIFALVEAAKILVEDGFAVFPYTTDDVVVAEKLVEAGCRVLMPWCAPIGSARGPTDTDGLRSIRARFRDIPLIVDAGIGRPSHAAQIMELGFDAILLNTAVAKASDPITMACAFTKAIEAGRLGYQSGLLAPRDVAIASTPVIGQAVFS